MGFYINPKDRSKEAWLASYGTRVPIQESRESSTLLPEGFHLVCLIDNGWMTAAAIAYDKDELMAFLAPDKRPRTWYLVADEDLISVEPSVASVLKEY